MLTPVAAEPQHDDANMQGNLPTGCACRHKEKQHTDMLCSLDYMQHDVGDDDGDYQAGDRQRADGSPQPPPSGLPPLLRIWDPCRAAACWCSQPRRQHVGTRCCVPTLICTCCRVALLVRGLHTATEGLTYPMSSFLQGLDQCCFDFECNWKSSTLSYTEQRPCTSVEPRMTRLRSSRDPIRNADPCQLWRSKPGGRSCANTNPCYSHT